MQWLWVHGLREILWHGEVPLEIINGLCPFMESPMKGDGLYQKTWDLGMAYLAWALSSQFLEEGNAGNAGRGILQNFAVANLRRTDRGC